MLFPPYQVVAAQGAFREEHSGGGHTIEVEYKPILAEDGKPTPSQREITTCSCGKEGQMIQILVNGNYMDRK